MGAAKLLGKQEQADILSAIAEAELQTSGEIRLHVETRCPGDVLDRAAKVFETLAMHKTELRNGVLFYLATDDRKFAILGDGGINAAVPSGFWNDVKTPLSGGWQRERRAKGLPQAYAWRERSCPSIFQLRRTTSMNCRTTSVLDHD